MNYNPTSKLTTFVRFSILHYNSYNQQLFGDQLGGPPIAGGNQATAAVARTARPSPPHIRSRRISSSTPISAIPGPTPTRLSRGSTKSWASIFSRFPAPTARALRRRLATFRHQQLTQSLASTKTTCRTTAATRSISTWPTSTGPRVATNPLRVRPVSPTPEPATGGVRWGRLPGAQGGFTFRQAVPLPSAAAPHPTSTTTTATFLLGLPTRIGKILLVPDEYNVRPGSTASMSGTSWNVNRRRRSIMASAGSTSRPDTLRPRH